MSNIRDLSETEAASLFFKRGKLYRFYPFVEENRGDEIIYKFNDYFDEQVVGRIKTNDIICVVDIKHLTVHLGDIGVSWSFFTVLIISGECVGYIFLQQGRNDIVLNQFYLELSEESV